MQRSILRRRIGTRLFSTGTMFRALTNKVFAENNFEITPEQYLVMSLVVDNNGLYQRQLSEITLKDRANISRIINILEEKGLVKRVVGSNGRQINKVVATLDAQELREKIKPAVKGIRQIATNSISDEELEICLNTLDKMYFNIQDKVNLQI